MNLNSETQERRVCFNSCFYNEKLELAIPGQLVLIVRLYTILLFPDAQLWPTDVFAKQKHKPKEGQGNANCQGHATLGPLGADTGVFPSLLS